jgi:hypothetical protein
MRDIRTTEYLATAMQRDVVITAPCDECHCARRHVDCAFVLLACEARLATVVAVLSCTATRTGRLTTHHVAEVLTVVRVTNSADNCELYPCGSCRLQGPTYDPSGTVYAIELDNETLVACSVSSFLTLPYFFASLLAALLLLVSAVVRVSDGSLYRLADDVVLRPVFTAGDVIECGLWQAEQIRSASSGRERMLSCNTVRLRRMVERPIEHVGEVAEILLEDTDVWPFVTPMDVPADVSVLN